MQEAGRYIVVVEVYMAQCVRRLTNWPADELHDNAWSHMQRKS
jgi:hypothetical protein